MLAAAAKEDRRTVRHGRVQRMPRLTQAAGYRFAMARGKQPFVALIIPR